MTESVPSSSEFCSSVSVGGAENIKVIVRCRLFNMKEKEGGQERVVELDSEQKTVVLSPIDSGNQPKSFAFDAVYNLFSTQTELYDGTFHEVIDGVLQGYNGTIFVYGQSGTGKFFTMQGIKNDPELCGVLPRAFEHIFHYISQFKGKQYLVYASYLQIYEIRLDAPNLMICPHPLDMIQSARTSYSCNNVYLADQEEVRDLLSKDQMKNLKVKEDPHKGFYVKDLSSYITKNVAEMKHLLSYGNSNKVVKETNMGIDIRKTCNIFTITVEHYKMNKDVESHVRMGRLHFVEFPASDRKKYGATSERTKEGTSIGSSLSPFAEVVAALTSPNKTRLIPYRSSQLTKLLKDSLGGTAKTVMVANIGPAACNYQETLSTLRCASRVKQIINEPKINIGQRYALMPEFYEEIARLKTWLADWTQTRKLSRSTKDIEPEKDESVTGDSAIQEYLQEQEAKLEEEKQTIQHKQKKSQGKENTFTDLPETLELLIQMEKASVEELSLKIKKLESKLLKGENSVSEETCEQTNVKENRDRQYGVTEDTERNNVREDPDRQNNLKEETDRYDNITEDTYSENKISKDTS